MPTLAQRASLEPPGARLAPAGAPFESHDAIGAIGAIDTPNSRTPQSLQSPRPAPTVRQRNRHTPRARLDATLDITLSRAAVSTLAVTLAMSLPLPWRVETIRPIRRDTAAVVSIALPRVEASRAMHVVMQSLPEAEFGALRLRPAV
ncbi:hypothetical protein [Pandoraea sp. PE-S2T-3]|uniref:hypothetical protein n=1 Tax=Pandoraea sp. PE-S2T-3 TaxID=1986993 RepID=UPI000B3F7896|nr:hypothetical protein [Pandoraea sp. PE-S2T-3]